MKHHINLYHDAFKPKFDVFAFGHLLVVACLALALTLLAYGWTAYSISQRQSDLLTMNKKVEAAEAQIAEFTQAVQVKAGDPRLAAKLTRVIDTVNAQNDLLVRLQQLSKQHSNRFSSVLDAFSAAKTDELWLTSFSLSGKDVLINGHLSEPSALPLWVGKLSETGKFAGQTFQDATLALNDEILSFSLTNIATNTVATELSPAKSLDVGNTSQGGSNGTE